MTRFFAAILVMALLVSCSSSETKNAGGDSALRTESQKAGGGPTFAVADLNGATRHFEEFKGKGPLVLNFWGTWCPPCRQELPDLKRIYAEYKPQGLEIVSLAVKDSPDRVRDFAQKNDMQWVLLMSSRPAELAFNVTVGVPTTIFLNREGVEVSRVIGLTTYEQFKEEIGKIM